MEFLWIYPITPLLKLIYKMSLVLLTSSKKILNPTQSYSASEDNIEEFL